MSGWIARIIHRLFDQNSPRAVKPIAPAMGDVAPAIAARTAPAGVLISVPTPAIPAAFSNVSQLDPTRQKLFDPALRHFAHGVRAGIPAFDDPQQKQKWQRIREAVMDQVLQGVAESEYRDHLVIRGSTLMKKWYGDEARLPGDIDWVVRQPSISFKSEWATACIEFFSNVLRNLSLESGRTVRDMLAVDEIWSYERAPGCRLSIPWISETLPPGHIQMDIVFGECQAIEPILTRIPILDRPDIELLAVTREQALASKLLWLRTDIEAQGKDFYDAVLLSRDAHLTLEQLFETFHLAKERWPDEKPTSWILDKPVAWNHFETEYPEFAWRHEEWELALQETLERMGL